MSPSTNAEHGNMSSHLTDTDLERYYLSVIRQGPEMDALEEPLLGCPECLWRSAETQDYVNVIRAAIIRGNFEAARKSPTVENREGRKRRAPLRPVQTPLVEFSASRRVPNPIRVFQLGNFERSLEP